MNAGRAFALFYLLACSVLAQEGDRDRAAGLMASGLALSTEKTPDALHRAAVSYQDAAALWRKLGEPAKQFEAIYDAAWPHYALGEYAEMSALLEQARDLAGPGADPKVKANLLTSFSVLHNAQGEYSRAIEELGQARDIYRQLADKSTELQVTSFQANAWRMQGNAQEKAKDLPVAIASHERAAALFQEAGDSGRSGSSLVHLGQLSEQIGTPDGWKNAAAYFTQAIPLLEAVPDRAGEANAWWGLATAADSLGQIEQSRDAFLKVIPLLPDLKNTRAEGIILKGLANAEDKLKHLPEAIAYYERALPLLAAARDVQNQFLAGMKLGMAREALGRKAEALEAYQNVAAVCRAAGNAPEEATALSRIGLLHMAARNWQAALDAFSAEQKLQAGLGDKTAEAMSWNSIGSIYQNRGEYKQKLDANLRALALDEGDSDRVRQAALLLAVGDSYSALHNAREALLYLERSLDMGGSDPDSKAIALVEMGEVHYGQSRPDEALRFENQALAISLTLDKPAFTNRIWTDIGLASQAQGERTKAKEIFEKTLASARERQDIQQTYTSLHNLARLYQDFGDSRSAEKLYNEALSLAQRDGEEEQEANTLSSLGMVYHSLAREEEARQTLGRALSQQRALGNKNGESIALNNLALVYGDTGQPQQALEALNQALSIMRALEDEAGVASQLRNLGTVYQGLGDYDGASSYYAQALDTQKSFKDEYGQGLTHNSLGVLDINAGNPRGALREFEEALPVVRKYGDRAGEAIILSNMANASIDAGDLMRAAATEQEALGIARETHDLNDEALALHGLGSVYERSGDFGRALDYTRQARVLWHELHNVDAEAKAWSLLARIEGKQGNPDAGLADAGESIKLLESQRGELRSEDLRAYFLASIGSPYQIRIDLLMEKHRLHPAMGFDRQAFETSERERARSLIDLLAESHADIRRGIDPDLLAQELAVERSLSSKASQMRLLSSEGADFRKLQVEIEDLTAERERIETRIRGLSPAFAALTQPQPLTLSRIQKQVLDRNTTLLEYSLGEERSYLFLITGTSFRTYQLPKRSDIVRAVNDFYAEVADFRKDRTNLPTSAALSHILLDPVASQITGRRLVIVGDGELGGIPFAALPEPSTGKALIIEHEIVTQPSASAIAILRRETAGRKRPSKEVAVIADPVFDARDERLKGVAPGAVPEVGTVPEVLTAAVRSGTRDGSDLARLTHTREEAESILALTAPGKSLELLDFSANKAAVLGDRLSGYRIIHFATHGLIDAAHPQLSGLALSLYDDKGRPVDGFLRLNDIFGMKLSAELVVLSACESGQGKLVGTEGLMGLTRGFFFAGAESLVVSLWKVDDAATGKLMSRFYQELLGTPRQRPAAALRAAQIWMITHSEWQDPYFWAAFTLQGEWK